jgi:hypothetical protein
VPRKDNIGSGTRGIEVQVFGDANAYNNKEKCKNDAIADVIKHPEEPTCRR